jgi:ankyrin repeat protein
LHIAHRLVPMSTEYPHAGPPESPPGADKLVPGGDGGRTPLGVAVEEGNVTTVKELVNAGADINKPCPVTPLMHAVALKNTKMVETLINLKADVNFGVDFDSTSI